MKLSVMTLGCPTWDLPTICRQAAAFEFDGIDFRGIQDQIDVTKLTAFTTDVKSTVRMLQDHGLVASGISSSISVCDGEKRTQSLDEAKRTIDAASAVGAPNVRVFGNGRADVDGHAVAARIGAEVVQSILELPGARQLSWNFETHDHWIRSQDCKLLLDVVTEPAFGAAWDVGHTRRIGGETAEQTLAALGDRVKYVHIKDAVYGPDHPRAMKDGWRYVLPGAGELHLNEAIHVLRQRGYDGWVMFEHEKRWHPELEEPEIAFPAFVRWFRGVIA